MREGVRSGTRPLWLRGAWAGALYGASYFAVEVLGAAILFEWLGAGAGIFRVLRHELLGLLPQYVALGLLLGLVVTPLVAWVEPRLPPRWHGPGTHLMALALAFVAVALAWNVESVLPGRFYVLAAFGAQGLILAAALAGLGLARLLARALHRPPEAPLVRGTAGLLLAGGVTAFALGFLRTPAARVAPRTGAPAAGSVNVVLVVIDTLRRDHVSAYGYPRKTSPHLDRLAAEGVLFERAYSTASWTLPAHASLFTGLHPSSHGTDVGQIRLPPRIPTLAGRLARAGYRTAGFSANPWLTPMSGLDRGFERLDYAGVQTVTGMLFVNLARERAEGMLGQEPADLGGREVTDRMLAWIRSASASGAPFFAFANYMEVHEPYGTVPPEDFSAFLSEPLPRSIGRTWVRDATLFLCTDCSPGEGGSGSGTEGLTCSDGRWRVEEKRRREATDLYDAGVLYVDRLVGRIRAALEAQGLLDRTLLVVTSDHGETLGERGEMGHGGLLYNSVLDVPLIARYPPRFTPGARVGEPVSLADVPATVEDVLGLPRTAPPDTVSLADAAALKARPERILAESFPVAERVWRAAGKRLGCNYQRAGMESASLQVGRDKLIWWSRGEPELYDLEADPREERNRAAEDPERTERLVAEMRAWRGELARAAAPAGDVVIDPATRKALESLGYVR